MGREHNPRPHIPLFNGYQRHNNGGSRWRSEIRLWARNGKGFTAKFPRRAAAIAARYRPITAAAQANDHKMHYPEPHPSLSTSPATRPPADSSAPRLICKTPIIQVRPSVVVEVAADAAMRGDHYRHLLRLVRHRADVSPADVET